MINKIFNMPIILFFYIYLIHVLFVGIIFRRVILETGGVRWKLNRKLYLHKEGSGMPILFLHGLTGSWRYWRRGTKKLANKYTLYCPDLLGFGRSPKPYSKYSLSEHLDALEPIVYEENRKMIIVAHSMGAIIALGMLARHPQKIKQMILIGLPYYPSRAIAEVEFSKYSLFSRLIISRSLIAPIICYLKDIFGLPFFALMVRIPVDIYRDYWKHTWNSASNSLFNTILASDVKQLLKNINPDDRKKIILAHGINDITSAVQYIQDLIGIFPEIAYKEIEGTHQLYLEKPDVVNSLLVD